MPHSRSLTVLLAAVVVAACDPQPTTGSLVVTVNGLPTGTQAAVRITGPEQFFQVVHATTTLEDLKPGVYVVVRDTVMVPDNCYGSTLVRDSVTVTRGRDVATTATYQVACGAITLNVFGLPDNVNGNVQVRGPLPFDPGSSDYDQNHVTSKNIGGLRVGQYEIVADSVTTFLGDRFKGAPAAQTLNVTASATAVGANVVYAQTTGTLAITVNGLPMSNSVQAITVTGPGGYLQRTAQSITLRGLSEGTYNVAASNISGTCPNIFNTTDLSQNFAVTIGTTQNASVTYAISAANPGDLNLKIDKILLSQATQNTDGSVPLITGKPAVVRVFGSANQCNSVTPKIRVTTSTGFVDTLDAGEDSVRVVQDESRFASSWNAVIPADKIQPGMGLFAEMDATGLVTESNEGDNRFPTAGDKAIDVRTGPTVGIRFVPIFQSSQNTTGNVDVNLLMDWPRKLHPVSSYDVDVHAAPMSTTGPLQACTSTATGLTGDGDCPSWTGMLSELRSMHLTEGSPRFYYGVARTSFTSGVAGIAYIGPTSTSSPNDIAARTGMGWDFTSPNTNSNSASRVLAHELGHNFGRLHSPCGGPFSPDPSYPYTNGRIGATGWDPLEGFKAGDAFTDVMGYCGSQWISDYTYMAMLNWLATAGRTPSSPMVTAASEQPSLLIWGRISDGAVVLEPAFEISARPEPIEPGPNRIAALDGNGSEIFAISFAGSRVADLPGENETFAFTVPVSALRGRTLASLRLTARGRSATNVASIDVAAEPNAVLSRVNSRIARLRWDATRFPVVMVRDARTGQVLSFARGGDMTIATTGDALDLNFSNRLRSTRRYREFR